MAVDSWLFHQCRGSLLPPTLRFYTWFPVTLSLGYFQKKWPDHWSDLTWKGHKLTLVRRPSGGRGVLHQGDLTYCLTSPMNGYARPDAYGFLCQFLIQGWKNLGYPLTFGSSGRGYHHETNCFRLATSADLTDQNGNKFIGSAQLWRGDTVLQHGSMALQPDLDLQALVFGTPKSARGLPNSLGKPALLSFQSIIDSLTQSAAETFGITLQSQPLSPSEWDDIARFIPKTIVPSG